MVMSAPGTESFKQDFEKWDLLKRQLLVALEQAGSTLAKKAQAAAAKDRLAAGIDDTAPPDYRKQVDAYFRHWQLEDGKFSVGPFNLNHRDHREES